MLFKGGGRLFDNVPKTVFILPNILTDKNPDVFARHIAHYFRFQIDVGRLCHKNKSARNICRFVRPFADSAALRKNFLNANVSARALRAFAAHPETSQSECQFRRVTNEMSAMIIAVVRIRTAANVRNMFVDVAVQIRRRRCFHNFTPQL